MKSFIFKDWKAAWIAGLEPGTRFMTRRPVKPHPIGWMVDPTVDLVAEPGDLVFDINNNLMKLRESRGEGKRRLGELNAYPYPGRFSPGEIGYVREKWRTDGVYDNLAPRDIPDDVPITFPPFKTPSQTYWSLGKIRVSIHLPERFARSFYKVVGVGVERVRAISEEDCALEGLENYPIEGHELSETIYDSRTIQDAFEMLWDSMYALSDLDWKHNPWTWIYTLEKLEGACL